MVARVKDIADNPLALAASHQDSERREEIPESRPSKTNCPGKIEHHQAFGMTGLLQKLRCMWARCTWRQKLTQVENVCSFRNLPGGGFGGH